MHHTENAHPRRALPWRAVAGWAIAVGGLLLTAATLVELSLENASPSAEAALFCVMFLVGTAVQAGAMVPLSIGWGDGRGAVGGSLLGKVALLAFGALLLTTQTLYVVTAYTLGESSPAGPGLETIVSVFSLTQAVALIVGAALIARAAVLKGAARWSLLVLAVVVVAMGATVTLTEHVVAVGVAHLSSTVAQVVVGVVIARGRVAEGGQ